MNKLVDKDSGDVKIVSGATELAPPTEVRIVNKNKAVSISWADPEDVIYNGADLAIWAGTLVVRKEGSAPKDHRDGIIVKDCKSPNLHRYSTLDETGLTNGTTYYYGIFPYTTKGIFTYTCRICVTPSTLTLIPPTIKEVNAHNGGARLLISNYASGKSVKIIYKKDSPPTSLTDGTVVSGGTGGSVYVDGLTTGARYFFAAYVFSNSYTSALSEVKSARVKSYSLFGYKILKSDSNTSSRVEYTDDAVGMNPAWVDLTTGVFNYGSWGDSWFVRKNRAVMLRSNKTVAYELNPNDYTKKIDGTASDVSNVNFDGNAMSEMPKVWLKTWEDSKYNYVNISDVQLDADFHQDAYIGNDGKPRDVFYMSMFTGSIQNNKMRSLKGLRPTTGTNGQQELTAAGLNGAGWTTWTYSRWNLINCLLVLMSKSTNTQASFGYGNYTGGSSAGNLLTTGGASARGQFTGTNKSNDYMKVFHIENYYADMWKRIEGFVTGSNGRILVKTTPPYNSTGSGYDDTGVAPSGGSGGYITQMLLDNHGFIPSVTGGSETTYFSDGFWYAANCYAFVGGSCSYGFICGAFALHVDGAFSAAGWSFGACLSCEQPAA